MHYIKIYGRIYLKSTITDWRIQLVAQTLASMQSNHYELTVEQNWDRPIVSAVIAAQTV